MSLYHINNSNFSQIIQISLPQYSYQHTRYYTKWVYEQQFEQQHIIWKMKLTELVSHQVKFFVLKKNNKTKSELKSFPKSSRNSGDVPMSSFFNWLKKKLLVISSPNYALVNWNPLSEISSPIKEKPNRFVIFLKLEIVKLFITGNFAAWHLLPIFLGNSTFMLPWY